MDLTVGESCLFLVIWQAVFRDCGMVSWWGLRRGEVPVSRALTGHSEGSSQQTLILQTPAHWVLRECSGYYAVTAFEAL